MLNYKAMADDVDVSAPTLKEWLSVLQASNLIYILSPYFNNIGKRFIKTPKVYFLDTGLASYLTGWKTPETLREGAMSGAMFETYAVSEILKSYWHNGKQPNIYYYRNKEGQEIDVLLEENGTFYPVEIKKKTNLTKEDIRHFSILEKLQLKQGTGAVLCMATNPLSITQNVQRIPITYL